MERNSLFRSSETGTQRRRPTMAHVTADTEIRPTTIDIPQPVLDDLRERLDRARWPDELPGDGDYGVKQSYIRSLYDHWRDGVRLAGGRAAGSTRTRSSRRPSTARTSTSCTSAPPSPTRCRSSSPTAGPARCSSFSTSSARSPTRGRTAATRRGVPPGHPVDPGLWLLGPDPRARLEPTSASPRPGSS